MKPQYTGTVLLAMLTALIAEDGPLETGKLGLIENEEDILPTTPFGDIQQAQYEGYALSAAIAYGTPHLADDGSAQVQVIPKEFKPTGDATESVCHHVGLFATDGLSLIASARLDPPLTFANDQDVEMVGFTHRLEQPVESGENVIP